VKILDEDLKLSVLLVTYNQQDYVGRALESLFKQEYDGSIEVVIADDASTDATVELIRNYEGRDSRFVFNIWQHTPISVLLGIISAVFLLVLASTWQCWKGMITGLVLKS
jgi:glycosyltransferase involved in cell wall biosynthesis